MTKFDDLATSALAHCSFLLFLLFVCAGDAQGQNFPVDSFRCYPARNATRLDSAVILRDAFNPFNSDTVDLLATVRFCNPVKQTRRGFKLEIRNSNHRLTNYVTTPHSEATRIVTASNQFGTQTLTLQGPSSLLVPSQEAGATASPGLDHFLCYGASGAMIDQRWGLDDGHYTGNHRVMFPITFCNPAEKDHNGVTTTIQLPEIHMVCYSITRARQRYTADVTINNQFGPQSMSLIAADVLCVPSLMLSVQ